MSSNAQRICFVCRVKVNYPDPFVIVVGKGYAHRSCIDRTETSAKSLSWTVSNSHPHPRVYTQAVLPEENKKIAEALDARAAREAKVFGLSSFPCPSCKAPETTAADDWEASVLCDEVKKRAKQIGVKADISDLVGRDGTPYSVCLACGTLFLPKTALAGLKASHARLKCAAEKELNSIEQRRHDRSHWSFYVSKLLLVTIFAVGGSAIAYTGYNLYQQGAFSEIMGLTEDF